jgi:N-acetylglucosamine malate deacetylase 1
MSARPSPPRSDLPLPSGPVLVLAAHPGDELVGCGGTLALHAARGERVHVVIVFDGAGAGGAAAQRESLAARRRAECLAGGRHLGLESYEFWDYPEGREPTPDELFFGARLLAGRITELEPRTLYVPWEGEQRHDQRVLAQGTQLALEMAERSPTVLGYEVWTALGAMQLVDITSVRAAKQAALREHRSLPGPRDLARSAEAFAPFAGNALPLRPGHAA